MPITSSYEIQADVFFADDADVAAKNALFLSGPDVPVRLRTDPPPNQRLIVDGWRVVVVEREPNAEGMSRLRGFLGDNEVIVLDRISAAEVVPAVKKVLSVLARHADSTAAPASMGGSRS